MAAVPVSDGSFDNDVLKSEKPVVVDFWAEWCGPCKMIAPALEEISSELGDKVTVAKVNIDDNPKTPAAYGVRGIGSIYYLAYAATHLEFVNEGPLWATVAFTIFASTVVHGLTAGWVMDWVTRSGGPGR